MTENLHDFLEYISLVMESSTVHSILLISHTKLDKQGVRCCFERF